MNIYTEKAKTMETPVSLTPIYDRHKSKKTLKPVELSIYKKGSIRNYIRIGLNTLAWDERKNRPKDLRDGFLMDEAIKKVTEYCLHMDSQNQSYDKKSIEQYLKTEKLTDVYNFYDFYQTRVLDNQALKTNTRDNKNNLLKWLKLFAPVLNLYEIDYAFVSKFRSYLFEQKIQKSKDVKAPLRKNYIDSLEKHLKATMNIAIKEGLIEKNPYSNLKRLSERTKKDYLSRAELDILERLVENIESHYVPHLKKFLFACYTGLRISDLRQLRKSHFKKESKGWSMYLHRMYKVDKDVYLPLYSLFGGRAEKIVLDVLESEDNTDRLIFDYSSDPNYNRVLKTIQAKSGIDGKHFASHLARHTFGTNLAKETGNVFTVMRFMGINKTETAQIYINMAQGSNVDQLKDSFKEW